MILQVFVVSCYMQVTEGRAMAHPREHEACQSAYNWTGETNHKYMDFQIKAYVSIWIFGRKKPCKLLGIECCCGNSGEGEINTDHHGWCGIWVTL